MSATTTAVSSAVKPVRRFPPPCWTQDEALALIQSYRDRWYALRRGYLRSADWDAVAEEIGRICPGAITPKTSAQCRHKMEKLRQRYRAEKQRSLAFSGGRFLSTWFYFEAMDSMERNGTTGSNPDDDQININHLQIVQSKNNGLNLNPGRGIRFKQAASASRTPGFRYPAQEEDKLVSASGTSIYKALQQEEDDDEEEFDDVYHETLGKNAKIRFQTEFDHSGVRPRKYMKIGSNSNHNSNNHGYSNEKGENVEEYDDEDDDDNDDDGLTGRRYIDGERDGKKNNEDSIGQIVASIKMLADGFVKMEKMKMEMVHEIEKMRMEAEVKRNKLLLESQKQIVEAFVKGITESKKQH